MSPSSCTYRRSPVSMLPAASAQNRKASSASGLCPTWIVRERSATTLAIPTPHLTRLLMERVEILRMFAVLGPLAGALRRFVLEEIGVRPARAGRVALQLARAGPQHEPEEVGRDGATNRVRLRERPRGVAAGQVEHADVVAGIHVERRQHGVRLKGHWEEELRA